MQLKQFRVKPDHQVDLRDWPTQIAPRYKSGAAKRVLQKES